MSIHTDKLAYESYKLYCLMVAVKPLDYTSWLDTRAKLGEFHDTPASIVGYVR